MEIVKFNLKVMENKDCLTFEKIWEMEESRFFGKLLNSIEAHGATVVTDCECERVTGILGSIFKKKQLAKNLISAQNNQVKQHIVQYNTLGTLI